MAINKNLVVTADSLEGYKITKYLGTVVGMAIKGQISLGQTAEGYLKNELEMMKMAESLGANAIIGVRVIHRESYYIMIYGTAVVVESEIH